MLTSSLEICLFAMIATRMSIFLMTKQFLCSGKLVFTFFTLQAELRDS
jgi:hypothetical protein